MSKRSPKPNGAENRMARALDQLAEFERYQEEVAPILQRAVAEAWSPEKIRNHPKIAAMMAAKQVTIALFDSDSARAHTALKDITDRNEGKAKERVELSGKLEKLSDEELDALLLTQARDFDEPSDSDDGRH